MNIKLPYVDFYYSDFITGTAHLTHQQKGIYITLFSHAGTLNGRGLPNNFDQLCRIADLYDPNIEKMEELKQDLTFILNDKFTIMDDGKYHQKRQFTDRLGQVHKIKVKSENGSKGGLAKAKLKSSEVSDSDSESLFNYIWKNIKVKRGSKPEAYKKFVIHALKIKPETIVEKYNALCSSVTEQHFIPHLSKWLKDQRWEEELPTNKEVIDNFGIQPKKDDDYLKWLDWVKKGRRHLSISDDMVKKMFDKNLITEEEFKKW
jgi:uncharacterized protein YdaU (DUF1376 family)